MYVPLRFQRGLRILVRGVHSNRFLGRIDAHARRAGRKAILTERGEEISYADLNRRSYAVAEELVCRGLVQGGRVAFLCPPGTSFVATLLGVWRAGGVAVPLCMTHPEEELAYSISESESTIIAASSDECVERLRPLVQGKEYCELGKTFFRDADCSFVSSEPSSDITAQVDDCETNKQADSLVGDIDGDALVIFTSGTTGRPKGVVLSHANIEALVSVLVDAWRWTPNDRILHILPLHHLHGLGNKLLCALWSGASVAFSSPKPDVVWNRLARAREDGLTLFMAVPSNYSLLIRAFDAAGAESPSMQAAVKGAQYLRLMVSGSMSLPTPVLDRWRDITGHVLLERYGMTELGMVLSQPLEGDCFPGTVGQPLPLVEVKLSVPESQLLVRGPAVFSR